MASNNAVRRSWCTFRMRRKWRANRNRHRSGNVTYLTGLVVVGIATALASAEAKSDQTILTTVGAAPSVSRHQSAARSAFLALMGSVLAIPAGMLPAYGLLATISELEFSVPWIELIFIVVGLPLAAYVVTWALSFGSSIRTQKLSAKRQVA